MYGGAGCDFLRFFLCVDDAAFVEDARVREYLEIAPPLFAQLEDGIERYHANFRNPIQSSANFLRHGYESDFCG